MNTYSAGTIKATAKTTEAKQDSAGLELPAPPQPNPCTPAKTASEAKTASPHDAIIPSSHPRAESLHTRHKLVEGFERGLVVAEGLLAHGRGEAFDYLLGEKTMYAAKSACKAAAAALHLAENPVISVNGNAAALCARQIVRIAKQSRAALEINLFYDSDKRRAAIAQRLRECGAECILGINPDKMVVLNGTDSARRMVDADGIMAADVVVVPLEDGDRTDALKQAKKTVVTFDLNPLSRTAQTADISIIDNIIRSSEILADECQKLASASDSTLEKIILNFNNAENLLRSVKQINSNLQKQQQNILQKRDGGKRQ